MPAIKKAYLPDFDRRDIPTLLDLATGEMVPLLKDAIEEETLNNPATLGKGDISWDGVPLTFRGARLSEFKDGAWVALKKWKEFRGANGYWLQKRFPLRVLLTTAAGAKYIIDLLREYRGGVQIEYQPSAVPPVQPVTHFLQKIHGFLTPRKMISVNFKP